MRSWKDKYIQILTITLKNISLLGGIIFHKRDKIMRNTACYI